MKRKKEIKIGAIVELWIRRWKILLAAMVCGGILIGILAYVRDYRNYNEQMTASENTDKQSISKKENQKKLTDVEKNAVDITVMYNDFYIQQQEYLENSIMMCIDSNEVYKAELVFRVSTEEKEDAYSIQKIYAELLDGMELYDWLNSKLSGKSLMLSEIISIDKKEGTNLLGSDIFSINIVHYDEKMCSQLKDLIIEFIDTRRMELLESVGEHEVRIISDVLSLTTDKTILEYQRNKSSELAQLKSEIIGREKDFTKAQEEYYALLLPEKTEISNTETDSMNAEVEEDEEQNKPSFQVTNIIIGLFAAVVIYTLSIVSLCIANKKFLKTDSFEDLYDIANIGSMSKDGKNRDVLSSVMYVMVQKRKFKNVQLVGIDLSEDVIKQCADMAKELERNGIECTVVTDILNNPKEVCKLLDAESAVLVAETDRTSYDTIDAIIDMLSKQKIEIVGGVISA